MNVETLTTAEKNPDNGQSPTPEQGRSLAEIRRQPLVVSSDMQLFDTGKFEHMQRIAAAMSQARLVPKHFWQSPGDCLQVVEQASRWAMSPFAVAQKTFVIDGKLGYEAQLIAAAVNSSHILQERLDHRYEGSGADLVCIVSGRLRGESKMREKKSPPIKNIRIKNSPLWQTDPEQQLLYWTQRAWARAHCSDVLLGVYTPDELVDDAAYGPTFARDITPPRPTREAVDPAAAGHENLDEKFRETMREPTPSSGEPKPDPETGEIKEPAATAEPAKPESYGQPAAEATDAAVRAEAKFAALATTKAVKNAYFTDADITAYRKADESAAAAMYDKHWQRVSKGK